MNKVFFTADTHFGQERALTLSRRPFKSVKDMDEYMIEQWNDIVGPNDYVYHLGDFGDYSIRPRLNGNIHLILGNYDISFIDTIKADEEKLEMLKSYFIDIDNSAVLKIEDLNTNIENIKDKVSTLYMVHKPIDCVRDISIAFNLFGHIHGRQKVKRYGIDVGVDANFFRPMSADDVVFYMNAIVNGYYDNNIYE